MLPEGWKRKSVDDIFDVQLGKMLNKEAKEKYPQYNYLGNSNVLWGSFSMNKLNKMYFSEKERIKFRLKHGDILMCEGGEVGRCAIWKMEHSDIFFQKAIHRLRSKGNVCPTFFQNFMQSISGTKLLDDYTTKTSIAHLTREKLLAIPILLPPLPEQKKIAAILSTWDRAIEGTEKLLANSQQQKKALMQQLLTGKKRLPGFTGEWRNLKLKTFLQESVIPSPQPDPKKRITVRLNLNGVEKREVRGTESIDATNYFTRKAGQFIYGKQNIHKGAFGIIPKILDGFETSQDIPCFDFLPNVCPAWFFYYFARENIHHTLETKMTGTGSKRLNQKTFLNLTCYAPPISEQQAIAAVLSTADEEITAFESDLSRLRQEKKALMQQLLTGKRRVTVD